MNNIKEVILFNPRFLISTEGFLCCPSNPVIGVIDDTWAFNTSNGWEVAVSTLYDDSNQILATVNAEAFRSTTSSAFISLNERSYILDELTLKTLEDLHLS